ncbi:MAG: hypothetical protein ACFFCS_02740 [Candidatus Hodarchaeota archaeon]
MALGAVGLGVYQVFFADQPSKIFFDTNDAAVDLPVWGWNPVPNLLISYNTQAGDSVLLEYSCQAQLVINGISFMKVCFVIDGVTLESTSYGRLEGAFSDDGFAEYGTIVIRHYIENPTAGAHNVSISIYVDDSSTGTNVRNSLLTVEIF